MLNMFQNSFLELILQVQTIISLMDKILVIGAGGQLGKELTKALADRYGKDHIIATDFQASLSSKFDYCTFQTLNVKDKDSLASFVDDKKR